MVVRSTVMMAICQAGAKSGRLRRKGASRMAEDASSTPKAFGLEKRPSSRKYWSPANLKNGGKSASHSRYNRWLVTRTGNRIWTIDCVAIAKIGRAHV